MPDMQLRHKLKKVMDVAEFGEQIAERPKRIGFLIFSIFVGIGLIGLITLVVVTVKFNHTVSARLE